MAGQQIELFDTSRRTDETQQITYKVDKITFDVTPVYNGDSEKTISDIILRLIEKDTFDKP